MTDADWLTDEVFTVTGLFTPEECLALIARSEEDGYEEALLVSPDGNLRIPDIRNNDRVILDDRDLAADLWERVEEFVPIEMEGYRACGLNERFRFYRYDPGQLFEWHQDSTFERDSGETSFLTLLVYLNEGFEGGETSFNDECSEESFDEFQVVPETGMGLFFVHTVHHKGEVVVSGRKYVLRTDVMYRPRRKRRRA